MTLCDAIHREAQWVIDRIRSRRYDQAFPAGE
jgi:hypothetical protein